MPRRTRATPARSESDQDCYTVAEFCTRNRISRSTFYALRAEGRGPRVMRVGAAVRISREAAAAWRAQMEAAS